MKEPLTAKEHEAIMDALVLLIDKFHDEKHPIKGGRVFDIYQKIGQALGEENIELHWTPIPRRTNEIR